MASDRIRISLQLSGCVISNHDRYFTHPIVWLVPKYTKDRISKRRINAEREDCALQNDSRLFWRGLACCSRPYLQDQNQPMPIGPTFKSEISGQKNSVRGRARTESNRARYTGCLSLKRRQF